MPNTDNTKASSNPNEDLLARLNALRPTPISLERSSSPFYPTSTTLSGRTEIDSVTALLRRTAAETALENNTDSDLASRFAKLGRGGGRNDALTLSQKQSKADGTDAGQDIEITTHVGGEPEYANEEEDDKTLDQLLEELGGDATVWTQAGAQQQDIRHTRDLLSEAREALKVAAAARAEEERRGIDIHETEMPPGCDMSRLGLEGQQHNVDDEGWKEHVTPANHTQGDDDMRPEARTLDEDTQDDKEAEALIRLAIESAQFERLHADDGAGAPDNDSNHEHDEAGHTSEFDSSFTMPSAPTELPTSPTTFPSLPSASTTGFSSLPQTPTSIPSRKGKPNSSSKTNLPTYTDDDIATWCCICNEDAVVKCLGCDGDLYCGECWAQGHTGSGVGMEERGHRAVQFVRPGENGSKVRKRRVGVGG